ncbi:SDR family NAD(P)-dependent oxidoreductase [Ructibacterium gallinarum]|uniref:SDR family oxidoreductase n=1 Tax=Ructibacterium gallinarum TaxID=2779355 RepID=A0A9D5M1I4_9FIRM|nr:SDR family oxidoreductase [Ructibacterium gallinarum]MBE5040575.1 SDR family oxidoreductase [Ructibacterium gallinarum]
MFDLTGKRALVTGSTQGIGFAIAKTLAEYGASVCVNGASSMEKCKAASAKIENCVPILADLSDSSGVDRLYAQSGDVDILVLNASIQQKNDWQIVTAEEFDRQMICNVRNSFLLIQKYIPYMKQRGWGRILTIGSINQYKQHPELVAYAASKSAQFNIVQNMARQLAPYGVTVNNLSPGVIETPRNQAALADAAYRKRVEDSIACGHTGKTGDCAGAALLLCSDAGRYITGIDLIVDGGMHL